MKDQVTQELFRKFGIIGAVFITLGIVITSLSTVFLSIGLLSIAGCPALLARIVGLILGLMMLNFLLAIARRPSMSGNIREKK